MKIRQVYISSLLYPQTFQHASSSSGMAIHFSANQGVYIDTGLIQFKHLCMHTSIDFRLTYFKAEVSDPVVLANFLSADGVSSPRPRHGSIGPRPYVTTFTRIPWLHTQRGLPLYAVLSPHWIKVVGYKESFLLGLQQSRVTDRPVFQTKHSM